MEAKKWGKGAETGMCEDPHKTVMVTDGLCDQRWGVDGTGAATMEMAMFY